MATDWWSTGANLAVATGTALLAFLTWCLARATRAEVSATRQSAAETARAAEAAQHQAEAARGMLELAPRGGRASAAHHSGHVDGRG
jgi:hypothetical protein